MVGSSRRQETFKTESQAARGPSSSPLSLPKPPSLTLHSVSEQISGQKTLAFASGPHAHCTVHSHSGSACGSTAWWVKGWKRGGDRDIATTTGTSVTLIHSQDSPIEGLVVVLPARDDAEVRQCVGWEHALQRC